MTVDIRREGSLRDQRVEPGGAGEGAAERAFVVERRDDDLGAA
jgi:hypothetical protein